MTTCGYAHEVLSEFLCSNGVIALILFKFELLSPSSAITYNWVTLKPPVGRLNFLFMLIGRKIRISSAGSSSYNENKPRLIDFINHKVFSIGRQTPYYPPIVGRLSAD